MDTTDKTKREEQPQGSSGDSSNESSPPKKMKSASEVQAGSSKESSPSSEEEETEAPKEKHWDHPLLNKVVVLDQAIVFENDKVQVVQLLGRDQSQKDDGVIRSSSTLVKFFATETLPEFVMLFDCGSIDDVKELNAGLAKYKVTSIDVVVFSHNHIDHIGGLGMLKVYPKSVFTNQSIPIERDFHFFRDELIAFRTPGHSDDDIAVLVNAEKRIVLAGDTFESHEDFVDQQSWTEYSNDPKKQDLSQCFLLSVGEVFVPGHGPAFKLAELKTYVTPSNMTTVRRITKSDDGTAWLLKMFSYPTAHSIVVTTSSDIDPVSLFYINCNPNWLVHTGLNTVTQPPSRVIPNVFLNPDICRRVDDEYDPLPGPQYDSLMGEIQYAIDDVITIVRVPFFGGKMLPAVFLRVLDDTRYISTILPGATPRQSEIIYELIFGSRFRCKPLSKADVDRLNATPILKFTKYGIHQKLVYHWMVLSD